MAQSLQNWSVCGHVNQHYSAFFFAMTQSLQGACGHTDVKMKWGPNIQVGGGEGGGRDLQVFFCNIYTR